MPIEFTDKLKADIILAAATLAGPQADGGQVAGEVTRIARLLDDNSAPMMAFERLEQRASNVVDRKAFTGEVLYVDTEQSSNRPIVFVRTEPSEHHKDGIEMARMDRLDSQEAEASRALAQQLAGLVGHKVLLRIDVEKANGKNVRILRDVEDRGAGGADLQGHTNATGWQFIDWSTRSELAGRLAKLGARRQAAMQPA